MTRAPRFLRPKVLLVDLPQDVHAAVESVGFTTTSGSLGVPLRRSPGVRSYFEPVQPPNGSLPGFAEQEVVVVQLKTPSAEPLTSDNARPRDKDVRFWAPPDAPVVDSRPLMAHWHRKHADRILRHGGIFVFFVTPCFRADIVFGEPLGSGVHVREQVEWTEWDLLSELGEVTVESDVGSEVEFIAGTVFDPLASAVEDSTFRGVLDASYSVQGRWVPLARNKYGQTVAAVLADDSPGSDDPERSRGLIVLLPQVNDLAGCVTTLLSEVLPAFSPRLFPDSGRASWLDRPEYQLPAVRELTDAIEAVRERAASDVSKLEADIAAAQLADGWQHTLLSGTGDELAKAVAVALREVGLRDVRHVDDVEEERTAGRRREDIQVWGGPDDGAPVMLVEVKGISGLPKEANSLQVIKYSAPRMREWGRTDIRSLAVINQQRGLPPLMRENEAVFQQDVLDNAEDQDLSLLTTLDLFRLVRNMRRWGWPADVVAPLLYRAGRVRPVPLSYELVGAVDGFFEQAGAVTLTVTGAGFGVGDQLAFVLPIDYHEETVSSVHVDDNAVDRAEPGQRVGIATTLTKDQARNGVLAYRVTHAATGAASG